MTWKFCMTCEELELLTHIRNFTTLLYVILRRESSEWLESSVESDLSMRFVIWNLDLSLSRFCFLETLFLVQEQLIKKSILLACFRDSRKQNFDIRDLWFAIVSDREPCQRPPPRMTLNEIRVIPSVTLVLPTAPRGIPIWHPVKIPIRKSGAINLSHNLCLLYCKLSGKFFSDKSLNGLKRQTRVRMFLKTIYEFRKSKSEALHVLTECTAWVCNLLKVSSWRDNTNFDCNKSVIITVSSKFISWVVTQHCYKPSVAWLQRRLVSRTYHFIQL